MLRRNKIRRLLSRLFLLSKTNLFRFPFFLFITAYKRLKYLPYTFMSSKNKNRLKLILQPFRRVPIKHQLKRCKVKLLDILQFYFIYNSDDTKSLHFNVLTITDLFSKAWTSYNSRPKITPTKRKKLSKTC